MYTCTLAVVESSCRVLAQFEDPTPQSHAWPDHDNTHTILMDYIILCAV